jgi:hypothetical protein
MKKYRQAFDLKFKDSMVIKGLWEESFENWFEQLPRREKIIVNNYLYKRVKAERKQLLEEINKFTDKRIKIMPYDAYFAEDLKKFLKLLNK